MSYLISLVLIIFFNFTLGFIVLIKNPKKHINISFFLFVLSMGGWIISNYFSNVTTSYQEAFFWNKFIFFITPYITFSLVYFSIVFPKNILNVTFLRIIILFIPVLLSNIFTLNNLVIKTITFLPEGGTGVVFGSESIYYVAQFVLYLILALGILLIKYRKTAGYEKTQLQYLLFSISATLFLALVTNLFIPLIFNNFLFSNLGPLFTAIMVTSTSYAIVKQHLLDIHLIIARSIGYILVLIILGGFYTFYILFIGSTLFNISFTINQFLFYGTITFIIAFTFPFIKRLIESFSNNFFYRGHYDSQKLLYALSKIMSSTINLDILTDRILDKTLSQMHITKGAFILLQKNDQNTIEYVKTKGYEKLSLTQKELQSLKENRTIVLFEDLEEGETKQIMRELNLAAVLPLSVDDNKIGFVALGEKASGNAYSQQDIDILEILAPQLSVAIQNAKEYDEIKKFNVTLREEVDSATKNLKEANERLKSIDRLKDEFVSLASHELRTPMTAISSYIWMLKDDINITDQQRKYLENTYESTQRLIRLVNDMLNVSRIESGRLIIKPKAINLEELIQETLTELLPKAQELNLSLVVEKPSAALPNVFADADKIKEVIMNLVGNSLKFTPPGGKITISFSENNHFVEVHVADTGKGIKKEDMPKLFQKFGMIEGNYLKTNPGQGTGLGLYLSKGIVQLHGGSMWFQSEGENKGSTFSFSLKKA